MNARKLAAAIALGTGALTASAVYAADATSTTNSVKEYASDSVVTTKVKAAIVGEKSLNAMDITVKTTDGVTTLTGTVGTTAQVQDATRVAAGVDGVKKVDNQLRVDPSKSSK
jgi:hyperosmotically inducible protein